MTALPPSHPAQRRTSPHVGHVNTITRVTSGGAPGAGLTAPPRSTHGTRSAASQRPRAAQRSAAQHAPLPPPGGAEGRRPPSQRPYSASPYLRQTLRLSAAPDQPAQHPAATTSLQRRVGPCLRAARAHGSPAGGRAFLIELRADERAGRGRPEQSSAECVDCKG